MRGTINAPNAAPWPTQTAKVHARGAVPPRRRTVAHGRLCVCGAASIFAARKRTQAIPFGGVLADSRLPRIVPTSTSARAVHACCRDCGRHLHGSFFLLGGAEEQRWGNVILLERDFLVENDFHYFCSAGLLSTVSFRHYFSAGLAWRSRNSRPVSPPLPRSGVSANPAPGLDLREDSNLGAFTISCPFHRNDTAK